MCQYVSKNNKKCRYKNTWFLNWGGKVLFCCEKHYQMWKRLKAKKKI